MIEAKKYADSEGTFTAVLATEVPHYCFPCDKNTPHTCQVWESSCGGYEDYKYTCNVCGAIHWVDGCDS